MHDQEPLITYGEEPGLAADVFISILRRSGLAERRPIDDRPRLQAMLDRASLIIVARRHDGEAVGVARSVSDFASCCYLADLAVDSSLQRRGMGRRLMLETKRAVHGGQPEGQGWPIRCLLLSAPAAMNFYRQIPLGLLDNAFDFTAIT
jgi:GNAT superfamily N-acetyltransferase